jgi:hypothetical protein
LIAVSVAVLCTGCVSTQTVAARARLVNARIRASEGVVLVTRANPAVSVGTPVVIHGRGGLSAIVVSVHNPSRRALTDLPISVAVRTRSGRVVYLNASTSADYFQSHIASIGPGAATTWVLTTGRRLPRGRVLATVGFPALRTPVAGALPRIAASSRVRGSLGAEVTVSITSDSSIPQYDLPVYAVAVRGGRYVAAGQAAVAHLGTNGTATASVPLIGDSRGASLTLLVAPTIFS